MKTLNDFTQTLNVLIIEDEEVACNQIAKFFKKRFKSVDTASNGNEGFEKYCNRIDDKYDLIISDINMPQMDGLALLKKIRENDKKTSIVFVTARSESDMMLEAINYNINGYILKPINHDLLEMRIHEISNDLFFKRKYEHSKKESENYLSLLNQEASVSKTDIDGNIIFVNDSFCKVSGYTQEELVGKNHRILRHPDVPTKFYEEMWATILSGNIWEGKFKNIAKSGNTFFANTKIIPIYDDFQEKIIEYIAIRSLSTEEESKKREFNKKVIESITGYKKLIQELNLEKKSLFEKLGSLEDEMIFMNEKNRQNSKKISRLLKQIESYESNNLHLDKMDLLSKQDKQKQFDAMYKTYKRTHSINEGLLIKLAQLQKYQNEKTAELEKFMKLDEENKKRINDLKDLVTHFQKEIEKQKTQNKGEIVE